MTAIKRKPIKLHLLIFVFIVLASGWIGVILDSFLTDFKVTYAFIRLYTYGFLVYYVC